MSSFLSKFSLEGKVAVVTGVGPAMGSHFALALAEAGADVCVSARSRGTIDSVAEEIRGMGRKAIAVTADASKSPEIDALVGEAVKELGRLDVMVNHAGAGIPRTPLVEITDEGWDAAMHQALGSAMYGTRAAARVMIEQGEGGSIVNTSSIASIGTFPGNMVAYSTGKAAVNHFTRYAASELAGHDIRVNAILPGFFEGAKVPPEILAWLEANTPFPRPSKTDEPAPALLFLASDASSYVTGETLRVSGGGFLGG